MTTAAENDNPYEALERIFHEPNRLAILSNLCAAERGMSFSELRDACHLTDGNLNRHLKVLEEADAIRVRKSFVDDKPRTTITISKTGLERFSEYLSALSDVLEKASKALPAEKRDAVKHRTHGAACRVLTNTTFECSMATRKVTT